MGFLRCLLINDEHGNRIRCPFCMSALYLKCPSECTIDDSGHAVFEDGSDVYAVCVVCLYSEAFLAPAGKAVCITQGKEGSVRCEAREC